MKNKAHDLARYTFSEGEALLLDANVWLHIFSPPSGNTPSFARGYDAALKRMLAARTHLAVDALILSEYLNRYIRIEWAALHKQAQPNFKKFRQSPAFAAVGQGAALFARRILKLCSRYDNPFATANIDQVLTNFESGNQDFNDGLLSEACRHHGWKLVTDDGDFTSGGIEVLTGNPKLLAACR